MSDGVIPFACFVFVCFVFGAVACLRRSVEGGEMRFERYDINQDRSQGLSREENARASINSLGAALQRAMDEIEKAYAEIDRLTAENELLTTERYKLAAELDELRDKQAEPAKPQWMPPAALKDGEYRWNAADGTIRDTRGRGWSSDASLKLLKDWTCPPVAGRWQIADGKAEYLGP